VTKSKLQTNPVSKVIEPGYVNAYSHLSPKEARGIAYKCLYKELYPLWDETMVFLARFFKSNVCKDAVVLDAGCGNGNYIIDENRSQISWAVGVDVSPNVVKKNVCLDEIKIGTLEKLPFEDNSFNAIVSLWVLEHLEHPKDVFIELARVLQPGGFLMFCTPNKNFILLKLLSLFKMNWLINNVNKHLYGRNSEDIFSTFYRANTLKDIIKLSKNLFNVDVLRYNYDPSYTSYNLVTFNLSNKINNLFEKSGITIFKPHIIGILIKI
jgi:ubiquinone/menaquinone biosynthesis C-methylase UbiE